MPLKILLGSLLWLMALPALAQQDLAIQVTPFATLSFPADPIVSDTMGVRIFAAPTAEATYICVVTSLRQVDKDFQLSPSELSKFYTGVKKGILASSDAAHFDSQSEFTLQGLRGQQMSLLSPRSPDRPLFWQRILFVNDYMLAYSIATEQRPGPALSQVRDEFFNSLAFTISTDSLRQFTVNEQGQPSAEHGERVAENLGGIMGNFIFYALLLAAAVWGVRKLRRKH